MKNLKAVMPVGVVVLIALFTFSLSVEGQNIRKQQQAEAHPNANPLDIEMMLPDLSNDQKEAIKSIRLSMMDETLPLRNQIREKQAQLRTLQTSDNPNMRSIDKIIDESADLQAQVQKIGAANHQKIREILTDEQRIIFDNRSEMRARNQRSGFPGKRHRAPRH